MAVFGQFGVFLPTFGHIFMTHAKYYLIMGKHMRTPFQEVELVVLLLYTGCNVKY